jgi:hypothetical protein
VPASNEDEIKKRSIISMRVVAIIGVCMYFPGTEDESVRIDPTPNFLWGEGMRALIVVSHLVECGAL